MDLDRAMVEPKVQAPIDKAATELSNCISDLEQSLKDLYAQIKPILNPGEEPTGEGTPGEDTPEVSVLQRYLHDETVHINNIASMARRVTRRVEC